MLLWGKRVVGSEMVVSIGRGDAARRGRRAVIVGGGILRTRNRGDTSLCALCRRLPRAERVQRRVAGLLRVDGG